LDGAGWNEDELSYRCLVSIAPGIPGKSGTRFQAVQWSSFNDAGYSIYARKIFTIRYHRLVINTFTFTCIFISTAYSQVNNV
jgi:hypothetical protein